jgi:hypothetical protein
LSFYQLALSFVDGSGIILAGASRCSKSCKAPHADVSGVVDQMIAANRANRAKGRAGTHGSQLRAALAKKGKKLALLDDDELTALTSLQLQSTAVSDTGILELRSLAALRSLDISRTRVTASGATALKTVLPGCKITSWGRRPL